MAIMSYLAGPGMQGITGPCKGPSPALLEPWLEAAGPTVGRATKAPAGSCDGGIGNVTGLLVDHP